MERLARLGRKAKEAAAEAAVIAQARALAAQASLAEQVAAATAVEVMPLVRPWNPRRAGGRVRYVGLPPNRAALQLHQVVVSVPKTPSGFGLIIKDDASVAPGGASALVPARATIEMVGDTPISSKADIIAAIASIKVGECVDFSYRERPQPPEQRWVSKLPDGVIKEALPGMLGGVRGFCANTCSTVAAQHPAQLDFQGQL